MCNLDFLKRSANGWYWLFVCTQLLEMPFSIWWIEGSITGPYLRIFPIKQGYRPFCLVLVCVHVWLRFFLLGLCSITTKLQNKFNAECHMDLVMYLNLLLAQSQQRLQKQWPITSSRKSSESGKLAFGLDSVLVQMCPKLFLSLSGINKLK